jgi:hypothetical protein
VGERDSELGASPNNRQVATAAGITDQGQISKLLGRLQTHGLIHNTSGNHAKGEPNAWALTLKGRSVTQTLQSHGPLDADVQEDVIGMAT